MNALNITEPVMRDESIISNEVHEYGPQTGVNLNNPGEIRMPI